LDFKSELKDYIAQVIFEKEEDAGYGKVTTATCGAGTSQESNPCPVMQFYYICQRLTTQPGDG
jgi:hypothetical protein